MTDTEAEKPVRVFFALWPNDAERSALAAWQPALQQLCGGRATPADKLHNTLVFLGELQPERLEALQLAAQEVRGVCFDLVFDIARYWGHNHIVYAAPAIVPKVLALLVSELEQRLRQHHFRFDQRAYKPHVTLLRHAHWMDSPLPLMRKVVWEMREFALVQSLSEGAGVRYEVLARFRLH